MRREKVKRAKRLHDMQFAFGQVMATEESAEDLQHPLEVELGQLESGNRLMEEPSHLGRAPDPQQKKGTGVSIADVDA